MNSQQLDCAYEIFKGIFGRDLLFAIGGRYSLIKQGILPETRPINDVDIVVFSGTAKYQAEDAFSTANELLRIGVRDYNNHPFSKYGMVIKSSKSDKYGDGELGLSRLPNGRVDPANSHRSFELILTEKKVSTTKPKRPSSLSDVLLPELDPYTTIYQGPASSILRDITYVTTASTNTTYTASSHYSADVPMDSTVMSKVSRKSTELSPGLYDQTIRLASMIKLQDLMLTNLGKAITIDIFANEFDGNNEDLIHSDNGDLVGYYGILKAKYRYCADGKTPQSSFDKHLNDLIQSRKSKRIKGVNTIEDIDLLISNWRSGKQK
jgi:hypothetical protein